MLHLVQLIRSRLLRPIAGLALAAAVLAPALHASAAGDYVVRPGDSLYVIARRLAVPLDELLRVNGLALTSVILPGQHLTVPAAGTGAGGTTGGRPASPSPAPGTTTYTVRAGDGLGKIASRLGVTLNALLAANRMTATSLIVPGQVLVVPGSASGGTGGGSTPSAPAPGGSSGSTYTVRAGDGLGKIASRLGVTLDALLSANRLTVRSLIIPGQQLRIPGAGAPAAPAQPAQPSQPAQPTQPTQPTQPARPSAGPAYTVRPGDSLGAIASQHNIGLGDLLSVNGFTANSLITPGMQISLPAGARLNPVDKVLGYALAQVGKPWKFWSRGPDSFDCSGLTLAAFAQAGVSLIHQSAAQARQGQPVDFIAEPIRAGDLVFQDTDGDGVINHVGIALSATTWVHSRSASRPVMWGAIPADSNIVAVRRVLS